MLNIGKRSLCLLPLILRLVIASKVRCACDGVRAAYRKITVSLDVMPCSLVYVRSYHRSGRISCLHFQVNKGYVFGEMKTRAGENLLRA